MNELNRIRERYSRRDLRGLEKDYSLTSVVNRFFESEKERAIVALFACHGIHPLHSQKVLEVGCGTGNNLRMLGRLGLLSENLVGNELIESRLSQARESLPKGTKLYSGDACELPFLKESFDIVLQSTVFSSILSNEFQKRLAQKMWEWIKPGGGILWYDFIYNNPWNPDVRGVPVRIVRRLFPEGDLSYKRLTLAPPLARFVTGIHPVLYSFFNAFPLLRTHILGWVQKPLR